MLRNDGEYPADYAKGKFWYLCWKIRKKKKKKKKSAVKHSLEETFYLTS